MPNDPTATPTDLHWLTIADAARLIERRRLSPVELTDALLDRIEALDPQLNAYLLPTPEKAREQAPSRGARDHGGPLSRPAARHPVRAEGHLCDRRHPHDQPFENLREPSSRPKTRPPWRSSTRPARCCSASSRRMNSRMADRRSTCRGRRRAIRGTAIISPADRRAAPGAAVAAGFVPGGARLRHRRLDPRPGGAVRHRRPEADLRSGQPRRRLCQLLHLRSCRPDDVDGRGLRDHAAGDRRPRSRRTRQAPTARSRITGRR